MMPFPSNFEKYTENYPGFLYNCHLSFDSASTVDFYRGYFELLQGVEVTLGKIWTEMKKSRALPRHIGRQWRNSCLSRVTPRADC
jgi:hypothetical protein